MARLEISIRTATSDVIVAGDFNAKHHAWGLQSNDDKGELPSDLTCMLGLTICNQGDRPTWQKGDSKSYIDVTMASTNLAARVQCWNVSEEFSHSGHSYIEYNIKEADSGPRKEITRRNLKSIDQKKFEEVIIEKTENMVTGYTANDCAEVLVHALLEILDEVAPKEKVSTTRRSVYWWTPRIKNSGKRVTTYDVSTHGNENAQEVTHAQ